MWSKIKISWGHAVIFKSIAVPFAIVLIAIVLFLCDKKHFNDVVLLSVIASVIAASIFLLFENLSRAKEKIWKLAEIASEFLIYHEVYGNTTPVPCEYVLALKSTCNSFFYAKDLCVVKNDVIEAVADAMLEATNAVTNNQNNIEEKFKTLNECLDKLFE